MSIRKHIFDSNSEKTVYKTLLDNWKGKVDILPHIPFKSVIDISGLELSKGERDFLDITYFDYVITSLEDETLGEPLLVIEFDGLGMGYSHNGKYIQVEETEKDRYRKLKLDCKIKICEQEGLPLVVVSYPETNMQVEKMSILDAIIGDILAHREFVERFHGDSYELDKRLEGVKDPEEYQNIIDDYGIEREVSSKLKNNPISNRASKIQEELRKREIFKSYGFRFIYEDNKVGCEYYADIIGELRVSERVLVREVNCKFTDAGGIAQNIAELLLWKKVADFYGVNV